MELGERVFGALFFKFNWPLGGCGLGKVLGMDDFPFAYGVEWERERLMIAAQVRFHGNRMLAAMEEGG